MLLLDYCIGLSVNSTQDISLKKHTITNSMTTLPSDFYSQILVQIPSLQITNWVFLLCHIREI